MNYPKRNEKILFTIAAVVLVRCGESQQTAPTPEAHPDPVAEAPAISIHDAATDGDIEAVQQHLVAGADVNVKGGFADGTSLHYAVSEDSKKIVELLIAKGAGGNARDVDG